MRLRPSVLLRFLGVAVLFVAANPLRADTVRFACVGDSITAGYALKDPVRDAYPAQLARLLGEGYEVRNFGVSAATMMDQGNYPYRQREAHGEALAWKPDVVVIALGTNDTKVDNIPVHPDDFAASYHGLLARFRAANPDVKFFVCLPPPAFPAAMGIAEDVLVAEILPRIRAVAAAEKLPLIDLHTPLADAGALFPDKIHPNVEGAGRIAQIVYGEYMFHTQPAAESLDRAVNTAIVPVPRLEVDSYNWWTRHAQALLLGAKVDPQVVMIGDSITHFWAGEPAAGNVNGPQAWAATFGSRRVLNLGFGWDRTQNVLWRLDHGQFAGLHPQLVVLNIGTNNLSGTEHSRVNTPAEIAAGIGAIRERLRQLSPETHVLVMGVLPRGHQPTDGWRVPIKALNALLAQQFVGSADTTFLNIWERFLEPDGRMPQELMPDGTHPSDAGYAIWGRAIVETGLLPAVSE